MRVRRHRQARRYTLRIDAASREVVLTMPPRGSLQEARDFAQQHGGWIAARLKRMPEAAPFMHGVEVPLRASRTHRASPRRARHGLDRDRWTNRQRRCSASRASRRMSIAASATFSSARRVRDLEAASRRYAESSGAKVKRVSVRDQSSRWGSCSTTGVLSFSWRLILAPPYVLDYLAAHEVAHLKELNHSPRFWRLVRRLDPGFERAKSWLDAHGTDLHRYGLPQGAPGRLRGVAPALQKK